MTSFSSFRPLLLGEAPRQPHIGAFPLLPTPDPDLFFAECLSSPLCIYLFICSVSCTHPDPTLKRSSGKSETVSCSAWGPAHSRCTEHCLVTISAAPPGNAACLDIAWVPDNPWLRADGPLPPQGHCLEFGGGPKVPGSGERISEPALCPEQRAEEPRSSPLHHRALRSLGGDTWQERHSGIFRPPSVLLLGTSCLVVFISFLFSPSYGTHYSAEDPSVVAPIPQGQAINLASKVEMYGGQVPLGDSTGRTQPSPAEEDV